jgi:hypothetical protein
MTEREKITLVFSILYSHVKTSIRYFTETFPNDFLNYLYLFIQHQVKNFQLDYFGENMYFRFNIKNMPIYGTALPMFVPYSFIKFIFFRPKEEILFGEINHGILDPVPVFYIYPGLCISELNIFCILYTFWKRLFDKKNKIDLHTYLDHPRVIQIGKVFYEDPLETYSIRTFLHKYGYVSIPKIN